MAGAKKTPKAKVALGGLWEFDADGRVQVTRPDGSVTEVQARNGTARLRLQQVGTYTAGDLVATVSPGRRSAPGPARAPAEGEPDADAADPD